MSRPHPLLVTACLGAAAAAVFCTVWSATGASSRSAVADYHRGESLEALHMWPEAAAAWTQAIRRDPTYEPPYRRLAALFENQQNLAAAIAVWHDCVTHVPRAQHAWCRLSEDEAAAGLKGQALKDAETELRQDDSCPVASLVAGQILAATSMQTEALSRLRRALAAYPDNSELRLLYGRLLAEDLRPAEAADQLRPLIERRAPSPQALYWMAYSLDRSQTPASGSAATKEAEVDLKESLALQPNYPEAAGELGWLYQSTGRSAAAIPYLKRSLAQSPHQATTLYLLVNALRQSGRETESAFFLNRFRLESALDSRAKTLQKEYAVTHRLETALELAGVEHQLQNQTGIRKVLDEANLDHPNDPSIRALQLKLMEPAESSQSAGKLSANPGPALSGPLPSLPGATAKLPPSPSGAPSRIGALHGKQP